MALADHCELISRHCYAITMQGSVGKPNDSQQIRKRPECIPIQE